MAFTVTKDKEFNIGPERCRFLSITTDGAEDNIDTGMDFIDTYQIQPVSMASGHIGDDIKFAKNSDSSGSASNGIIGVSGLASGDDFYIVVYGR